LKEAIVQQALGAKLMEITLISSTIPNVLLGQVLSLILTVSSASNQVLSIAEINIPGLLATFAYGSVATLFATMILWQGSGGSKITWRRFILCLFSSLFDSAGRILFLTGNSFLSLPRLCILTTLTTPTVMIISIVFLKARFGWKSWVGAGMSVLGVIFLFTAQMYINPDIENGVINTKTGYAMGILSALSYGASNVMMELMMKCNVSSTEADSTDYAVNCHHRIEEPQVTVQKGVDFDHVEIEKAQSNESINKVAPSVFENKNAVASVLSIYYSSCTMWSLVYLLLRGIDRELQYFRVNGGPYIFDHLIPCTTYCASMVSFYFLMPIMIRRASAALFNLSLLTYNFYAVFVGSYICSEPLKVEFVIPCLVVIAGIVLCNVDPYPIKTEGERNEQSFTLEF